MQGLSAGTAYHADPALIESEQALEPGMSRRLQPLAEAAETQAGCLPAPEPKSALPWEKQKAEKMHRIS
jgi:hypothetical protein